MFTLEQIKAAHSKVKSGSDFPAYIKEMKGLGIKKYEHFVADAHIEYYGLTGFRLSAAAKWAPVAIAAQGALGKLQHALAIHQAGQTDYITFCAQAAEAGVEMWAVDTDAMTCTYYDAAGNSMLVEAIPQL